MAISRREHGPVRKEGGALPHVKGPNPFSRGYTRFIARNPSILRKKFDARRWRPIELRLAT
jgi:hypothetical protein